MTIWLTWTKNRWQQVFGVVDPNFKLLVQIIDDTYGGGQEMVLTAICKCLVLHFNEWCWGSCQNWWNYEHRKEQSEFAPPFTGKPLIDSRFIFQCGNDPKHTANAVKAYLGRKTHNRTLSAMGWSLKTFAHSCFSALVKGACKCPVRSVRWDIDQCVQFVCVSGSKAVSQLHYNTLSEIHVWK